MILNYLTFFSYLSFEILYQFYSSMYHMTLSSICVCVCVCVSLSLSPSLSLSFSHSPSLSFSHSLISIFIIIVNLIDQKGKRKMWERDLKGFADDYNFVSLQFVSEATESVVPEEATTAKVN